MDFSKYAFEVIDVSVRGTPEMYVNINGITISKKAIEDMSYPTYVRPLIDTTHKAFALQTCKQTDERAMKFSKARGEQDSGINLSATAVMRTIRTLMRDSWHDNKRYRIAGIYYPDAKAMVYDLSSAEELPPIRPLKKK